MAIPAPNHTPWTTLLNADHLQLSAVNPPDARRLGPVIGPGSKVRPCGGPATADGTGVICLEIDEDGKIERGYTIERMVMLTTEHVPLLRRYPAGVVTTLVVLLLVAAIIALA